MTASLPCNPARPRRTRLLLEAGRAFFILQHRLFPPLAGVARRLAESCDRLVLAEGKRLAAAPPASAPAVLELHTLLCRRDALMFLWALDSFDRHCRLAYRVIVHDDGSLREEDIALLRRKNERVEVIRRAEADLLMAERLAAFPNLSAFRAATFLGLKLLDFNCLAGGPWVLAFDPDILFFQPAAELERIVAHGEPTVHFMNDGHLYSRRPELSARFPEVLDGFNSGFLLYPHGFFPLEEMEEIAGWVLAHRDQVDRVDEQVILSIMAGRRPHAEFSRAFSAVGGDHPERAALVCKHYHSCAKQLFSLEGLRFALRRAH
jgi:hypothetical protein